MSSNMITEDLRIVKTKKALSAAMFSLLKNLSFRKITIKEICEEALVSRATFYAHFIDKYDLLIHWMTEIWPKDVHKGDTYEQIEIKINSHIQERMSIIKNLMNDADDETLGILFDFILSTIQLPVDKKSNEDQYVKNIVLSNFYAGGILSYLSWQIKNKFPQDVPIMNSHLYDMLMMLQETR